MGFAQGPDPKWDACQRGCRQPGEIDAEVLCPAGHTSYEFYSFTRQKPVCNEITWYIMRARSGGYQVNKAEGFKDGGYFSMEEANGLITYSQDKSLVRMAYEKYRNL